ncbi:MAG: PatB family C-S lyase [Bacilli bacterium]|jgi:cystathionine beta-lyase|nr:PatB family C-S lyase [Bacilli bacterium]
MKYNFDKIIDRRHTNAMKEEGWKNYLFSDKPNLNIPYHNDELIKMWIADMDFQTAPEIQQTLKKHIDHGIFGYSKIFDEKYYQIFNEWCAKNYDIIYPPNQITTSAGIVPAINLLIKLITKEDEKIVITTPSYAPFANAVKQNNRQLICVPLLNENDKMTMDFNELEHIFKDEKVKLFIFCNPYNPNGIKWSIKDITKLGEIAQKNNVWLISDEIHCDLLRSGVVHNPTALIIKDYPKLITCMSVSKTFNLAGLLISHIIIRDEELLKAYNEAKNGNENILSLVACQAAYQYGQKWLDELKSYLDNNFTYLKTFLDKNLPLTNFKIPDATYLAWVNLAAYTPQDVDLTEWFATECGVLLESGSQFVQDGDGYVRLNLACPQEKLVQTLNRLLEGINKKL